MGHPDLLCLDKSSVISLLKSPLGRIKLMEQLIARAIRLLRELWGPYAPTMWGCTKHVQILIDGNLVVDKPPVFVSAFLPLNTQQKKIARNIETVSCEYQFWGYVFSLLGGSPNDIDNKDKSLAFDDLEKKMFGKVLNDPKDTPFFRDKEHWRDQSGTKFFAENFTGVYIDGTRFRDDKNDRKIKSVQPKSIKHLQDRMNYLCHNHKDNYKHSSFVVESTDTVVIRLNHFSKYHSSAQPIAIEELLEDFTILRKKECCVIVPFIHELDTAIAKISGTLLTQRQYDGGWKFTKSSPLDVSSPLNTGEVGFSLSISRTDKQEQYFKEAEQFLLSKIVEDKYWCSTKNEYAGESFIANAFALMFLAIYNQTNHALLNQIVTHVHTALREDKIKSNLTCSDTTMTQLDEFYLICQNIRAMAYAYEHSVPGDLEESDLMHFRDVITTKVKDFRLKKTMEYDQVVFINAVALLSCCSIDDALNRDIDSFRDDLYQRLISHPEQPLARSFTITNPETFDEFTHWVKPWIIASLAKHKATDKMLLIDYTRALMKHHVEDGLVKIGRNKPYQIWAAAHWLYAIAMSRNCLKNYIEHK